LNQSAKLDCQAKRLNQTGRQNDEAKQLIQRFETADQVK
jgi:hypothetical protein